MMIMILKAPPPTTQIVHWQLEIMVIAALDFFVTGMEFFSKTKLYRWLQEHIIALLFQVSYIP
jgi:hypothetical protein